MVRHRTDGHGAISLDKRKREGKRDHEYDEEAAARTSIFNVSCVQ